MIWWLLVPLFAAALYYLLIVTEGTYLGTRVVILLYDWAASSYDRLKKLQYVHENYFLGVPLAERLRDVERPRVLDVATGTGRLLQALIPLWQSQGLAVGVDRSRTMLLRGRQVDSLEAAAPVQADAECLPFGSATFDAVTCLEAFEFFVRPRMALYEMHRVLRPGGVLLVSNRAGPESGLFPARASGRGRLEAWLAEQGFEEIETRRWQVHYDLIWARKAFTDSPTTSEREASISVTSSGYARRGDEYEA